MTGAAKLADKVYPGYDMGPGEVLALAESFRASAMHLQGTKPLGKQKSCAPYRLLAIHAIELYLNAYLLSGGHQPPLIRGMQHDLARRADLVAEAGIKLRSRTVQHLKDLSINREYLISRYGSHQADRLSQLTRLQATVEDVRRKVTTKLNGEVRPAKKIKTPARPGPASVALRA